MRRLSSKYIKNRSCVPELLGCPPFILWLQIKNLVYIKQETASLSTVIEMMEQEVSRVCVLIILWLRIYFVSSMDSFLPSAAQLLYRHLKSKIQWRSITPDKPEPHRQKSQRNDENLTFKALLFMMRMENAFFLNLQSQSTVMLLLRNLPYILVTRCL